HFWLPIFLLYLIWKLGYDRRALAAWTATAWLLLLVSFFWLPAPGDPLSHANEPHNVNYVFGPDGDVAQTWVHPWVWFGGLMTGLPLLVYLPTHFILARCCAPGGTATRAS